MLKNLKSKIEQIKDCELKNQQQKFVFSDGKYNSPIMIVGEAPGEKKMQLEFHLWEKLVCF